MTLVDIQLSPTRCEWSELREASLAAESMGFSTVWVFDHLAGVALGGHTMLECFTLLGALAEATTSIDLGALVVNVWNRQPGTLVSAAASVVRISGRPLHLGLGAGTSPRSAFATEQLAVGAEIVDAIADRHARVEQVLDLMDAEWRPDREDRFATFPFPSPSPTRIIGVNSVALSRVAGRRADGVNMPWHHPRRDEFFAAAEAEAAAHGRTVSRTVWTHYVAALLDPEHPTRVEMADARIDRLILAHLGHPSVLTDGGT